ncbi:MAG: hypothetical protein EBS86_16570 [Crocinitomicaceae bacterium]|nr:hypothetical protein [Crocinitomicaceae bacterium]
MVEENKSLVTNREFNLSILITIIKRHWLSPVFYVFIFSLSAFLYLRYTKPIYQSTSVLQIVEEDRVGEVLGENSTIASNTDLSKEIELLKRAQKFD